MATARSDLKPMAADEFAALLTVERLLLRLHQEWEGRDVQEDIQQCGIVITLLIESTAEDSGFEVPAFWDRVKAQP
jgi:hypothetical protein